MESSFGAAVLRLSSWRWSKLCAAGQTRGCCHFGSHRRATATIYRLECARRQAASAEFS